VGSTIDLSFGEQLLAGLPQFFLCVWELELNDWTRLLPEDPIYRMVVDLRGSQSFGSFRNAVDAAFTAAHSLARSLENRPALRDCLVALRQRHARQQAAHPWCWLRFYWERREAFDILDMLQDELLRYRGSAIVTPERLRVERWHEAAQRRLMDLHGCSPGFDWSIEDVEIGHVADLADCILRSTAEYRSTSVAEELAFEVELVRQRLEQVEVQGHSEDGTLDPIRRWAESTLKGIEERVVVLLCERGGSMPLADLAADPQIDWGGDSQSQVDCWDSTRKWINKKLRKEAPRLGAAWKLARVAGDATLLRAD